MVVDAPNNVMNRTHFPVYFSTWRIVLARSDGITGIDFTVLSKIVSATWTARKVKWFGSLIFCKAE